MQYIAEIEGQHLVALSSLPGHSKGCLWILNCIPPSELNKQTEE